MIKEAVANRIVALCKRKGITPNALAKLSGVDSSTLYGVLGKKSQNPGIVTIKKLCDGLDITIAEFFDADSFKELEQELR